MSYLKSTQVAVNSSSAKRSRTCQAEDQGEGDAEEGRQLKLLRAERLQRDDRAHPGVIYSPLTNIHGPL